jgi:hypothetical protein
MPHLSKKTILEVQREAFANASDRFELNPTLGHWRDLEITSVAWMRANVMQEEQLVAMLTPCHTAGWCEMLASPTKHHVFTPAGIDAAQTELVTR